MNLVAADVSPLTLLTGKVGADLRRLLQMNDGSWLRFASIFWRFSLPMDRPGDVAQASSPASSWGVPPQVGPRGETPPELAAEDGCATRFRGARRDFVRGMLTPAPLRGAGERFDALG